MNALNPADLISQLGKWQKKERPGIGVMSDSMLKRLRKSEVYPNSGARSHEQLGCLWDFLKQHHGCVRYFPRQLLSVPSPSQPTPRRVNVSGRWQVTFLESHVRDVTLTLQQNSDQLKGVSTHIKNDPTIIGDDKREYDLKGFRYEQFVLVNGISRDPNEIAINTFLFEIVGAGHKMSGAVTAYNTEDGREIFTRQCECTRIA